MHSLGLAVLDTCLVTPDAASHLAETIEAFTRLHDSTAVMVRSDGGIETTAYQRGGHTLSVERAVERAHDLLAHGRAVLLLEPTNRFTNRLTAMIRIDRDASRGGAGLERRVVDGIQAATLRTRFAEALLAAIPDAFVNGHPTQRIPGNLSVTFPGVEVDEVLRADPGLGLAMSSACTSGRTEPSHVLLALGLSRTLSRSTLRIGFGRATEWNDCRDCLERLVPLLMRSHSRSRLGQKMFTGSAR